MSQSQHLDPHEPEPDSIDWITPPTDGGERLDGVGPALLTADRVLTGRRGESAGSLEAIGEHDPAGAAVFLDGARIRAVGPTAELPVDLTELAGPDGPEGSTGGIESRSAILAGIDAALRTIDSRPGVERILTIGGECSVSVAPFAWLANKYGDDLAVVWIDSHPDVDTPDTGYDGYHAMAVTALAGRGDAEVLSHLPSQIDPSRIAWAGLHEWEPDCDEHVSSWGITAFGPDDLRTDTRPLIDWLHATGASRLAIHFDVDTIDADEVALGLGRVSGGLTAAQVHRLIADLGEAADVVGLTVAEYLPRELLALGTVLAGLPLVTG